MPLREGESRSNLAKLAIRPYRRFAKYLIKKTRLTRNSDWDAKIAVLTRELEDAHREQAATADILKVISRSAFDLDAVLGTLVNSAARLCQAENVQIFLRDGEVYRLAAHNGFSPAYQEYVREHPIPPGRGTLVARTALMAAPVNIPDVLTDPEYTWREGQRLAGFRSALGVPLIREGSCVGVMGMTRQTPQPFTKRQAELVTTFADQALIAIENVRLFQEVQGRTRELTEIARLPNGDGRGSQRHQPRSVKTTTCVRRYRRDSGATLSLGFCDSSQAWGERHLPPGSEPRVLARLPLLCGATSSRAWAWNRYWARRHRKPSGPYRRRPRRLRIHLR